jgi:uncharacterized protein YgbK (DUF1537 family)
MGDMIGIVADDITGANDIGIMYAKAGIPTHVYDFEAFDPASVRSDGSSAPGVVILDTNSRLDDWDTAYRKVFESTKRLKQAGARVFINKTCSVFRGNVGAEFDAMLDALRASFAVVVLGFPKNGRTTIEGIHYVHGKRLEHSEFRNDPVHPMTSSDVVGILASQTERRVGLLDYRTVRLGPDELRKRVELKRNDCHYLLLDVESQDSLRTIARAVRGDYVLCGSSALSEELALALDIPRRNEEDPGVPYRAGMGILCAAGSLMPQTARQVDYMKQIGTEVFELHTLNILTNTARQREVERLVQVVAERLSAGNHAVLHTSNDRSVVEETKRIGAERGLSTTEVSRLVSETIAITATTIMSRTGQNRLVVAGGETSAAVCAKLGVRGMKVWKEIEPGLPSCVTLTEPATLMVLKSGSFGKPDFIESAMRHLSQQ